MVDAVDAEIVRVDIPISAVGNFGLWLPPDAFTAGRYELQLFGLGADVEQLLETYPIRLR